MSKVVRADTARGYGDGEACDELLDGCPLSDPSECPFGCSDTCPSAKNPGGSIRAVTEPLNDGKESQ